MYAKINLRPKKIFELSKLEFSYGDSTFVPATIVHAVQRLRVRVMNGFSVRSRVRIKIRIRVRVGVTFNVMV